MEMSFNEVRVENMGQIMPLLYEAVQGKFSHKMLAFRLKQMLTYDDYMCWSIYKGDQMIGIFGLWKLEESYEIDHLYIKAFYKNEVVDQTIQQWITTYTTEAMLSSN